MYKMELPSKGLKRKRDKCSNVCAVKFCRSNTNSEEISLFRFPKDVERCKRWMINCDCGYLSSLSPRLYSSMYRVCSRHFDQQAFVKGIGRTPRLLQDAIPTLNLPERLADLHWINVNLIDHSYASVMPTTDEPAELKPGPFLESGPGAFQVKNEDSVSVNVAADTALPIPTSPLASTQTSTHLSAHTPRKNKLRNKICSLQAKNSYIGKKMNVRTGKKVMPTIEDFKTLCDKYLSSTCANFVKLQADFHKKTPKQRRYSKECLQLCLKIHCMSPKAYRYLSTLFIIPSKRTLKRMLKNFKFQ